MIRPTDDELKALPKLAREVLGLINANKLYREIADEIGRPIGTVRSRVHRARARVAAVREAAAAEAAKAVVA